MEGGDEAEGPSAVSQETDAVVEGAGLLDLLRVLLAFRTLPHVIILVFFSVGLQILARAGSVELSAFGYLSLAGGYTLTAGFSGIGLVQRWTTLPSSEGEYNGPRWRRALISFRICLLPLLFSGAVFVALQSLFGESSSLVPLGLGACFVIWAVVQGRGFGRFLAARSAANPPKPAPRSKATTGASIMSFIGIAVSLTVLLVMFGFLAGEEPLGLSWLLSQWPVMAMFAGVFAWSWRSTKVLRSKAALVQPSHAFAVRWMFLTQSMITWHLLTVWRHLALSPSNGLLLVEELVLMVFTVVMAIWGLTSKSFRSPLRVMNQTNALPFGLAFGYAYGGSVAMLTVVLSDMGSVMVAGHIVALLTLVWMQPRVLAATLSRHDATSDLRAFLEQHPAASETSTAALPSETSNAAESSPSESSSQTGSDDSTLGPSEGFEPEAANWKPPEVLANTVDWDDEVELVDVD